LVIILLIAGFFVSNFFTLINVMNVLRQTSYLAIITIGEMLVFIVGGFDLSIGSLVALTSVVTALITASSLSGSEATLTIVGATAGVLVAGLMGLANGAAVAFFRVAPFIVTLATMGIAAGLALYFSGGTPVWGIPNFMVSVFGSGTVGGVPTVFIIMVIVSVVMYLLLNQTHLGRYFWAIGGNESAAILSGINTKKYTILAYVLCGLFAGFTGILLTARVGAGEPVLGTGLMLQAMAAAVMGGTKVGGGEGNIPGVVLGAFFITLVGNVMNLANIGSYTQMIVMGAILMFAIITDEIIRK
jgi:ribose transport system permease protein